MEVLVFKTNLRSRKKINAAAVHLESLGGIIRWNADVHDVDRVLRIECNSLAPHTVKYRLQQAGYYCEELQ